MIILMPWSRIFTRTCPFLFLHLFPSLCIPENERKQKSTSCNLEYVHNSIKTIMEDCNLYHPIQNDTLYFKQISTDTSMSYFKDCSPLSNI